MGRRFYLGGVAPADAAKLYAVVQDAWNTAGKPGKPRFVGGAYWALGPNAAERGGAYIRDYYAFMGPMAEGFANSIPSSADAVQGAIQAYADAGIDELILWPCIADRDQIDRLADLLG